MSPSEIEALEAAIYFATIKHSKQLDKAGKPYVLHPLRVMMRCYPDPIAMQVAALHDVVEDCGVSLQDLEGAGFSPEVVAAVDLLTRPPKDAPNRPTHKEYIQRIIDSRNHLAIRVKMLDLEDNHNRMGELGPEHRGLEYRYVEALDMFYAAGAM